MQMNCRLISPFIYHQVKVPCITETFCLCRQNYKDIYLRLIIDSLFHFLSIDDRGLENYFKWWHCAVLGLFLTKQKLKFSCRTKKKLKLANKIMKII